MTLHTEKMHESMLNHPEPKPPMVYLYHPEESPRGQLMCMEEAATKKEKHGWVDTPAKFPNHKDPVYDRREENKHQVVEQAVKTELARQKKEQHDAAVAKEQQMVAEVPKWGAGVFDGRIEASDEEIDQSNREMLIGAMAHYKLIESAESVHHRKGEKALRADFKRLRDEHNAMRE